MNLNEWNLTNKDRIYIIILFVFSLITALKLLEFYMSGGIFNPDTAVYLISAYKYAGMDFNNICDVTELFYTPVLSYLTALLLMLGIDGQFSIYFVSSIFGILGYLGLYLLLRYRFNQILSLFGAILFGSCSIVLLHFGNGMIDIPGVSVSIWMLFFGLLATDKNPKYFYLLFPLAVIGFFTRYTSAFVLPIIFLYYLIKNDVSDLLDNCISDRALFKKQVISYLKSYEFKCILYSFIISIILAILICKFLLLDYGCSLTFLEQSHNSLNVATAYDSGSVSYNIDKSYYLEELVSVSLFGFYRSFDFTLTFLIFAILFGGFSLKLLNVFKNIPFFNFLKSYKKEYKTKYLELVFIVAMIVSALFSFIEFNFHLNHLISNIFLLISLTIFFSLINRYKINKDVQSINLIMFAWFLIYLLFISLYPIKTHRYVLPLLPPLIYFVVYGLESILHTFSFDFDTFDSLKSKFDSGESNDDYLNWMNVFPCILIVILIISTFTFIAPWEIQDPTVPTLESTNSWGFINDLINITEYIKETDSNYLSKDIASYYHHSRMIKLYLQTNVTFINDDSKQIDLSDSDYVILNEKVRFHNFHRIYHCGDFYLYSHN